MSDATVLLLHAGIADRRMWEAQIRALEARGRRVVAPDLAGFGDHPIRGGGSSHLRDVAALLDGPAAAVGNSLGGRVALELAIHRPELVERLVLIAPGLPGWPWSDEVRAGWDAEAAAFDRGDLEGAAEASVRLWVDGPRRSPADVDPAVRDLVRTMILRSYELDEDVPEEPLPGPPLLERLSEIRCPTLVLVGDEDVDDMGAIARHVAGAIDGAELVVIRGAGHVPTLEQPGETTRLILEFVGAAPPRP